MPRGEYERKPKTVRIAEQLRQLADEVEAELGKVEQARLLLKNLNDTVSDDLKVIHD